MAEDVQMFLAKALFDNIAESPDELAFRRGDVLSVLEQDTGGLDGWWLCSLRGRQGIAPGNRLKILSGMTGVDPARTDINPNDQSHRSGSRGKLPNKTVSPISEREGRSERCMDDYDVPTSRHLPYSRDNSPVPGAELYDIPSNRSALHGNLYDTPPSSKRASAERTPPASHRGSFDSVSYSGCANPLLPEEPLYQTPPNSRRTSAEPMPQLLSEGLYQTPPGMPQLLSEGLYQAPPSSRRTSAEQNPPMVGDGLYQTPPNSKRTSVEPNPPASGTERLYQTPPSSKRASLERILSDDQPTYDVPSPSRSVDLTTENTYSTPSSRRHSRDSTGLGVSLTSSTESGMSSVSNQPTSNRHSTASSLPESASLSSLDISGHDIYDLPPSDSRTTQKQLSMDSGIGLYDTPTTLLRPRTASPCTPEIPSRLSADCLSGKAQRLTPDIKRSRSLEHTIDDDLYDFPRSYAPKVGLKNKSLSLGSTGHKHDPAAIYDIPPQVTRDSIISARSDSSDESLRLSWDESLRLSSCSVDSVDGLYEDLLLDVDSALELLVKLQQEVTRSASRLLAFVSSTWRSKESLQTRIYDIKLACMALKKTLGEFLDFAQGTLNNSVRLSDKKLISRLSKHVTPLQQQWQTISSCLHSLEDIKWQVAQLSEPLDVTQEDHLGTITNLAKDLSPQVKKLASFIQASSSVLFKRSSDFLPYSQDSHMLKKPPIVPKSDVLTTKPNLNNVTFAAPKNRAMQHRPLPPTPEKSGSTCHKLKAMKVAGHSDESGTAALQDGNKSKCRDEDRDYTDLVQEYDYVQLETCDAAAQKSTVAKMPLEHGLLEGQRDQTSVRNPESTSCASAFPTAQPSETYLADDAKTKFDDVDTVPVKETANRPMLGQPVITGQEITEFEDDLKTPVNISGSNGFVIPDTPVLSSGVDLAANTPLLEPSDKQVLVYYSGQLDTHSTLLTNAIDTFLMCIQNNEPPKVFISNSKFVIISAHKLVYIGDTLHRNLANQEVREKVMECASQICQRLKNTVQATKIAALQYPSATAVQDMVDSVVDISHAAYQLKRVVTQAPSFGSLASPKGDY